MMMRTLAIQGCCRMDINTLLNLMESILEESITFMPDNGGVRPITGTMDFIYSGLKSRLHKELGNDVYQRLFRVIEPDDLGRNDIVNIYLGRKAQESDRKNLSKGLDIIRDFAKERGMEIGKITAEVNDPKTYDDAESWKPVLWKSDEPLSKIRVIRVPIKSYPKDQEIAPEVNVSNTNAAMIFNMLGLEYDYAGQVPVQRVSDLLRKLVKLKNMPDSKLAQFTKDDTERVTGGGMERVDDPDSAVTRIQRRPTGGFYSIGRDFNYVRQAIDNMIEVFKYAADKNLPVTWS